MKCCWKCRWSRSISPTAIRARTPCAPARTKTPISQRLNWALSRFTGYAGVTNLLGQRFLSDTDALSPALTALTRRGLYFYDNGAAASRWRPMWPAAQARLRPGQRATLDAIQTALEIDKHLSDTGRRRPAPMAAPSVRAFSIRSRWSASPPGPKALQARGFVLVPVSAIVSAAQIIGAAITRAVPRMLKIQCLPIFPTGPASASCCSTAQGQVFVGKRIDQTVEGWQMPQGGIDEGEEPRQAVLRELKEEIGTDKAEIIGEMDDWVTYDLPAHLVGVAFHGQYQGPAPEMVCPALHRARTATSTSPPMSRNSPTGNGWRWRSCRA